MSAEKKYFKKIKGDKTDMEKETFYLTTAIAYASRKPHFGNTYEAIMSDAVVRYKMQRGFDVRFMTGTDEH